MKRLTIRYQIQDENGTTETAGEMVLDLSSTEDEIVELGTTIDVTTRLEHVGTRPNDRA